jgi:hypothetical protein
MGGELARQLMTNVNPAVTICLCLLVLSLTFTEIGYEPGGTLLAFGVPLGRQGMALDIGQRIAAAPDPPAPSPTPPDRL